MRLNTAESRGLSGATPSSRTQGWPAKDLVNQRQKDKPYRTTNEWVYFHVTFPNMKTEKRNRKGTWIYLSKEVLEYIV